MHPARSSLFLLGLSPGLIAQAPEGTIALPPSNLIGHAHVVQTSRLLRPDATPANVTSEVDVLNRLDPRDHRHCFDDGTGQMAYSELHVAIHEANDNTNEAWSAVWYLEDPTAPGQPDAAGPITRLGPMPLPPPGFGTPAVTWFVGLGFGPPGTVTNNVRLFYGVGLPPAPGQNWPSDGLSVLAITDMTADAVRDVPGRGYGSVPFGNHSLWVPTANGAPSGLGLYLGTAPGSRQIFYCDMGGIGAGGTPIAVTNQTSYPISNGTGTTSLLSGLHPDVFGWNPGRQDDPGFLFYDDEMAGQIALVFCGFATQAPLPIALIPGFAPDSYGVLCIDLGGAVSFAGLIDGAGFARVTLPLSSAARAFVQASGGLDLVWQGFAVDFSGPGLRVHGSGCAFQHL